MVDDLALQPFNFKAIKYQPPVAKVVSLFAKFMPPDWKIYEKDALTEGQKTGRTILALFTGPTWCGPCLCLEKEVLTSALFASWAKQRVVLWKIEFFTGGQPVMQDESGAMGAKYHVVKFPTVLALKFDPQNPGQGKEVGRYAGYSSGEGAKDWLIHFETAAGMNSSFPPTP